MILLLILFTFPAIYIYRSIRTLIMLGKLDKPAEFNINFIDNLAVSQFPIESLGMHCLLDKEKEISARLSTMDTYKNWRGYIYISGTNRSVHNWIMEEYIINRKMTKEEVIHHINGDKTDNRITNLQLFASQAEHDRHHRNTKKQFGIWYSRLPEYANYSKFIGLF